MVDGWWCNRSVCDLAVAIRGLPGYKTVRFGVKDGDVSIRPSGGMAEATELYVYFPEDLYVLGSIRQGKMDNDGNLGYWVISHLINKTVKKHDWNGGHKQRHTANAKNLRAALAAVKRYMQPYTEKDIALQLADECYYTYMRNSRDKYKTSSSSVCGAVNGQLALYSSELNQEIRAWVKSEYYFMNPGVRDLLQQMVAAQDEEHAIVTKAFIASIVYKNMGKIYVKKAAGTHAVRNVDQVEFNRQFSTVDAVVYDDVNSMPEEIVERIATLHIMEAGTFVENVGVRISTDSYFLVGV
jgi:hypothetical protein